MKRLFLMMGTAAGLLGLAGTAAQADSTTMSPPSWTYNFKFDPALDGTNNNNANMTVTSSSSLPISGTSQVVLANLQLTVPNPSTGNYALNSSGWTATLAVNDLASGTGSQTSPTLTLSGAFVGPMANGQFTAPSFSQSQSNVLFNQSALSFSGPGWTKVTEPDGSTGYTWTAPSGNTYNVGEFSFTAPGAPNSNLVGAIGATIDVNGGTPATNPGNPPPTNPPPSNPGGGNTAGTPEPSTLLLSCFGVGFVGLSSWRRRRNLALRLA